MANIDESLYRQEVEELTDFVRSDANWTDLRGILIEKGFNPFDILLVSFIEDENEMEYGIIVKNDKKVFEYSRSTAEGKNNINYFEILEITDNNDVIVQYPQIEVAFKMIDEGY